MAKGKSVYAIIVTGQVNVITIYIKYPIMKLITGVISLRSFL